MVRFFFKLFIQFKNIYIFVYMCIYMYVCMYKCTSVYMHNYYCVCVYIYTHTVHTYTYIHTYIHICIYICIYVCIHTHTRFHVKCISFYRSWSRKQSRLSLLQAKARVRGLPALDLAFQPYQTTPTSDVKVFCVFFYLFDFTYAVSSAINFIPLSPSTPFM